MASSSSSSGACQLVQRHKTRSSQAPLIRQTAELLFQDLLAQSPQVLTQFVIPSLFGWLRDLAIRYDLQTKMSARLPRTTTSNQWNSAIETLTYWPWIFSVTTSSLVAANKPLLHPSSTGSFKNGLTALTPIFPFVPYASIACSC